MSSRISSNLLTAKSLLAENNQQVKGLFLHLSNKAQCNSLTLKVVDLLWSRGAITQTLWT